jgi:hypothetical protein
VLRREHRPEAFDQAFLTRMREWLEQA